MSKRLSHEEFVNRVSGNWDVVGRYDGAQRLVLVRCKKCGSEMSKRPLHIMYRTGSCRSCADKKRVSFNEIIADHGDWIEVDVSTPKNPNSTMKIGKVDYNKIREVYCGRILARKTHTAYAVTKKNRKMFMVHRLVLPSAKIVDHINHDGLDNRRENLRPCEHYQNMRNRSIQKNNTSGVTGVRKLGGRWLANICDGKGKIVKLGSYKTKKEAVAARKAAEIVYYGEYRRKQ